MRLIDAEEVIKAIDHHTFDTVEGLCLDEDITIILEEIPSAQPKKGKWILIRPDEDKAGNGLYECSECGKGDIHAPEVEVPFCWNCGAHMTGSGSVKERG